jgi:RNA polymerase sigma-70 factor (ECF subfamily)
MNNANVILSPNLSHGQGRSQELLTIVSSRLPSLYRSAYRLLGNAADAEDAVQDALLAAYRHLDQFEGRSKMSTWLNAIVRNSVRMRLRTRLRHMHVSLNEPIGDDPEHSLSDRLPDDEPTPEDECRNSELNKQLRNFSNQLFPALLRTFQLRAIEGLSIRETAKILGLPNGTVKARLSRACKKLKQLMRHALRPRSRDLTDAYVQGGVA